MTDLLTRLTPHLTNARVSHLTSDTGAHRMTTVYADADQSTGLRWTLAQLGGEWLITTLTGNPAGDDFAVLENLRPATGDELLWINATEKGFDA